MTSGSFIVSLDFELHWGVRDVVPLDSKRDYFLRAREAIPEMLRILREYQVHATWATVGFLFARNKRHLLDHLPEVRPAYSDTRLDPYRFLSELGEDERSDPFHYAHSLLQAIAQVPGQEIASHTFSHYYCLEDGQTERTFEADLQAAAAIGEPFGRVTSALVFPRGQYNPDYASALERLGVRSYRVPSNFFPYRPRRAGEDRLAHRALRLLDSYVPLGGSRAEACDPNFDGSVPLRAGLFLRPYSPARRQLEPMRLRRIKAAMHDAASHGRDFHLWWHPHNFGAHTAKNLAILGEVLDEYRVLRERSNWPSRNMGEAARVARCEE
jgi:peptidoglycan/xylan/chitin deacetylase (PgdA/CDA1 family)